MERAIVYTSKSCHYCKYIKDYLKEKGVAIDEKDIRENPAYKKQIEAMGYGGVPLTIIGQQKIYGYDIKAIGNALKNLKEY